MEYNPDKIMIENPDSTKLNDAISKHILSFRLGYFQFWNNMYSTLNKVKGKDKTAWYGDADFYFTLVHQRKTSDGFKRVFHVRNTCTCSDQCEWIVIHDKNALQEDLHIRVIYDNENSDYPERQYPEKVNLKFWQDRGYVCDYVEKFHMTNLGGIYGDIRDKGYVISYSKANVCPSMDKDWNKKWDESLARKDHFQLSGFLNTWRHFTSMLYSVCLNDDDA